jgi:ribonuclease HII
MRKITGNSAIDHSTADWVVGSDEVGYGAWAGPLVVCAVALPRGFNEPGIGDSKKLSEIQRGRVFDRFTKSTPVRHHLVWVHHQAIDQEGVWKALLRAHREALTTVLAQVAGSTLRVVDGFPNGTDGIGVPGAIGLPKADMLVPAVSLASIIAKVTRDRHMHELAGQYPGYGFASHKGYGTPEHQRALQEKGPCEIHRKSYAPIKNATFEQEEDPLFIIS